MPWMSYTVYSIFAFLKTLISFPHLPKLENLFLDAAVKSGFPSNFNRIVALRFSFGKYFNQTHPVFVHKHANNGFFSLDVNFLYNLRPVCM